ncbi:MAG: A/G-specific adenine glycosylase [Patescibacteria group bacterium]
MLQQTQTDRVVPKFLAFLQKFPTVQTLARASLRDVLVVWQGLGYNRRARMLHACARELEKTYAGIIPNEPLLLMKLPGIGPYTAYAVCVFAFHQAHPMIETNIRRVYIHHFFPSRDSVADRELVPVIEKTMDTKCPHEWFAALMDYGASLIQIVENPNRRSAGYVIQKPFRGSLREMRGKILRLMAERGAASLAILRRELKAEAHLASALSALEKEGFIKRVKNSIVLV